MLTTLRKVEGHENPVRWIDITTVLYVGGGGGLKYASKTAFWWETLSWITYGMHKISDRQIMMDVVYLSWDTS